MRTCNPLLQTGRRIRWVHPAQNSATMIHQVSPAFLQSLASAEEELFLINHSMIVSTIYYDNFNELIGNRL